MWHGLARISLLRPLTARQLLQLEDRIPLNPQTGQVIWKCFNKGVFACLTWSRCSLPASRTVLGSVLSSPVRGSSAAEDSGLVSGWGWSWGSGKAGWCKTEGCGDCGDCEDCEDCGDCEGRRGRTLLANATGRWHSEVLGCKLGSNLFPWRGSLRSWLSSEQV